MIFFFTFIAILFIISIIIIIYIFFLNYLFRNTMYDCKAPLSRFYYPDTRRIINAFIIIIIIILPSCRVTRWPVCDAAADWPS